MSTDQSSDCWAEFNLWRQLVVYVMHKEDKQPVVESFSKEAHRARSAGTTTCLCCSITSKSAQCSSYPLHSTIYCTNCWCQHTNECRGIKQRIITLQRWRRGITHSVYHMTPAQTPSKERKQLQALTAGSMSPTNYSPLTPQHYSQHSSMVVILGRGTS